MELVTTLRKLWRLRLVVAAIAVVAAFVGVMIAFRVSLPPEVESRKYEVGVATARVLVDTPNSQVVEIAPRGSDTLGVRASLLANLMVEGVIKGAIAKRAGLAPDELEVVGESSAAPPAGDTPPDPRGQVLTTRVLTNTDGEWLPIIEIEAQGPDAASAARLADAALVGLRDYLDTKAAEDEVSDARRLRVSALGAPQARDVVRGPRLIVAIAASIFVFLAGCALTLAVIALVRGWSAASEEERLAGVTPPEGEPPHDGVFDERRPIDDGEYAFADVQARMKSA